MDFGGEEDLRGRTDGVSGVSDVDRMRDVWGVMEDDEMLWPDKDTSGLDMFAEEPDAGEGRVDAEGKILQHSGNVGRWRDNELSCIGVTKRDLGDGETSEEALWFSGVITGGAAELSGSESRSWLCFDLGEGLGEGGGECWNSGWTWVVVMAKGCGARRGEGRGAAGSGGRQRTAGLGGPHWEAGQMEGWMEVDFVRRRNDEKQGCE